MGSGVESLRRGAAEDDADEEDVADRTAPLSVPVHILGAARPTERRIVIAPSNREQRATLTVVTGLGAGRVYAIADEGCRLGRTPEVEVVIDDAAVSRVHARILKRDQGLILEDLGSTNGTYVDGRRITGETVLRSGDRIQLGESAVLRFSLVDDAEEALQRRLYETSTRDPLTGAYNRAYLGERMLAETAAARRHGNELSLVMLDVDHFKQVNDNHGHLAGDAVLAGVAARIIRLLRVEDVLARFGGEEFAVVLRNTSIMGAAQLAERLRVGIASEPVSAGSVSVSVTASLGVASFGELRSDQGLTELFALADARLYAAKSAGRDRVVAIGSGASRSTIELP